MPKELEGARLAGSGLEGGGMSQPGGAAFATARSSPDTEEGRRLVDSQTVAEAGTSRSVFDEVSLMPPARAKSER